MQRQIEAAEQLQGVGFTKLGNSPLYRSEDFVVSPREDGTFQFFDNYHLPYHDPNLAGLRGIKIGKFGFGSDWTESLVFVGIDRQRRNYALEYTANGSGGPVDGNPPKIQDFAGKSFAEQLVEAGFIAIDQEAGVYHRELQDYHRETLGLYALLSDGYIDRIVKPAEPSYYGARGTGRRLIEGLGVNLAEFATDLRFRSFLDELDKKRSTTTILNASNEVFDFNYDQSGVLTITGIKRELKPEELGVVTEEKVEETGFVVGGVNRTDIIKGLKSINGQSIKGLERVMGRGAISMAGFLGDGESLLAVLANDNDFVLSQGLNHQQLGRMIRYARTLHQLLGVSQFTYQGRNFKYEETAWRGMQESPFADGTATNIDLKVSNLDNGKSFWCSGLLGEMVERYGFYEGPNSGYRLNPQDVIDTFDFLKSK